MANLGNNNNNNIPMKKTEQKNRRFSTGLFTEPKPIPNYLRASIGSCHDFCKYGTKHTFQANPRPFLTRKRAPITPDEQSDKNHMGKQLLASSTKLEPVSSRRQPSQQKNASTVHQSPWNWKQPNRTSLKGSSNARTLVRQNEAGKDVIRTSKTSKKSSPLPSSSSRSSVKAPTAKSRTSKSLPKKAETKNNVEQEPEIEKPNYEDVPEKIIHMHEPKDEKRDEDLAKATAFIGSSSKQKQRMDSNSKRALRFIPKETDTTPRKLRFRRGKVLEIQTGNNGSMGMEKRLRILANSDSEFIRKRNKPTNNPGLLNTVIEETASKLVKMSKSKVEALVGAFETLIKIQDSDSPRTPKMF